MTRSLLALMLGLAALPAVAQTACIDADLKVREAAALRVQAREEGLAGDLPRACDTLDEVADRYEDARDLFEDCGRSLVAIDLRRASRGVDDLKRRGGCS